MLSTIEQSLHFPASAQILFDIYINPVLHTQVIGSDVQISSEPGSYFTAFDGMLAGVTLCAVPGKLIVQRWRSSHFKPTDADSILVLNFVQDQNQGRIDLAHVNVPKHEFEPVSQGWETYYWKPLRDYLKRTARHAI